MNVGDKFNIIADHWWKFSYGELPFKSDVVVICSVDEDVVFDVIRNNKNIGKLKVTKDIAKSFFKPVSTYDPRFPTKKVVIVGLFNGKWQIQFQNRKPYQKEFLNCVLNTNAPEVFDHLLDAVECAEGYNLTVEDVRHHFCIKDTWQVDDKMKQRIEKFREVTYE